MNQINKTNQFEDPAWCSPVVLDMGAIEFPPCHNSFPPACNIFDTVYPTELGEETRPGAVKPSASFRSLSDIDCSTAANDGQASTLFSAPKNPHRIPANTPPVFWGLRPRICLPLLRLVTNGNVGQAPSDT